MLDGCSSTLISPSLRVTTRWLEVVAGVELIPHLNGLFPCRSHNSAHRRERLYRSEAKAFLRNFDFGVTQSSPPSRTGLPMNTADEGAKRYPANLVLGLLPRHSQAGAVEAGGPRESRFEGMSLLQASGNGPIHKLPGRSPATRPMPERKMPATER